MSPEHFTRWKKVSPKDLQAIFPKPLEPAAKVAEDIKSFHRDVFQFIVSEGEVNFLHEFIKRFPQYKSYNLEELRNRLPEYVSLDERMGLEGKKIYEIRVLPTKAYGKFIYRAEGSGYATQDRAGEGNVLKLLEVYKKQGGIGNPRATYVAPRPSKAMRYFNQETGGIWIIKKNILENVKWEDIDTTEYVVEGVMPLQYVEKLLVTEKMRKVILEKYGPNNTQLFGRPLKDVVVGIDLSDSSKIRKTILELNLQAE